jgi:hypothetical protein
MVGKLTEIHKDDEFYPTRDHWIGRVGFVTELSDWGNGWKRFMFLPDKGNGIVGFYAAKFDILYNEKDV